MRIQKQADENILLSLKKKFDQKEGMQKELEEKIAFLRGKITDMEEEGQVKSRKVQVLEEQVRELCVYVCIYGSAGGAGMRETVVGSYILGSYRGYSSRRWGVTGH